MKALTVLSFVLALGACFFSLTGGSGSGSARASAVVGDDSTAESLRDELAALRKSSRELLDRLGDVDERLTALEMRPVPTAPVRQPVAKEVPSESAEVLEQLTAALETGQASSSTELQAFVLDVLQSKEEAEQAERAQRRLQETQDRVNQRVEDLRVELGLDSRQANDMARVLVNEEVRRDELFARMREEGGGGFDRQSMREGMREIHETSQRELGEILTPDQLTRYGELQSERRGWRGFGGDRGAGGGRGGRGGNRDV